MTKTSFAIEKPRELGPDGDITISELNNLAGFDFIEELVHFNHLLKIESRFDCNNSCGNLTYSNFLLKTKTYFPFIKNQEVGPDGEILVRTTGQLQLRLQS